MLHSKALAALRSSILEEQLTHADARKVLARYDDFSAKLTEFQISDGPGPTKEEFQIWRDDILLVWAVREKEIEVQSAAMAIQQRRQPRNT